MKALVIEDDSAIARMTRRILESEGYVVDVANTGQEGETMALVSEYDLIILDLGLPDKPGILVVQALRSAARPTPIMVLTGSIDSETTVRALDAGADDYVNKPIMTDEFRARVRALVRRGGATRTEALVVRNVTLNRLTRLAMVDGKQLKLTVKEFSLLEHLMLQPNVMVSRTELLQKLWDLEFDPGTNVVDVSVSRLRKKLRETGAQLRIGGRRGMGFMLEEPTAG